jgi:hypothetical protein
MRVGDLVKRKSGRGYIGIIVHMYENEEPSVRWVGHGKSRCQPSLLEVINASR